LKAVINIPLTASVGDTFFMVLEVRDDQPAFLTTYQLVKIVVAAQ
jgi:hypothetical protein